MTSSPTPVDAPAAAPADNAATTPVGDSQSVPVAAPASLAPAPAPPAPTAPDRYDLSLEGFSIDPVLVQNADPVLRDLGLSNDAANKLMPVAREIMARTQETVMRQIEDAAAVQKKTWYDAFVADPEIGGARRSETEHFAAKGLDALGYRDGHPFRDALNASGFGNHPDMLRAFRRLGELVGEDGGLVRPLTASSRAKPVWERLYPDDGR
jgi:hypothetical protein